MVNLLKWNAKDIICKKGKHKGKYTRISLSRRVAVCFCSQSREDTRPSRTWCRNYDYPSCKYELPSRTRKHIFTLKPWGLHTSWHWWRWSGHQHCCTGSRPVESWCWAAGKKQHVSTKLYIKTERRNLKREILNTFDRAGMKRFPTLQSREMDSFSSSLISQLTCFSSWNHHHSHSNEVLFYS